MLKHIRPAMTMMIVMTVLTGIIYPLVVAGIAQAVFPRQANGSLLREGDRVLGSALIGQQFDSPRYFHSRPSATTPAYNAAASSASNFGPTSKSLAVRVKSDAAKLLAKNRGRPIPVDLVTASASGLDPDITPAAALFQAPRVAAARALPAETVKALVDRHIDNRVFGVVGEPHVNVLELNLALDRLGKH